MNKVFMTYLWDFFSLLPFYLIFLVIPGILFIQSFLPNINFITNILFLTFSAGGLIILTFILTLLTHLVFLISKKWDLSWFKRPDKAENCSYKNDKINENDYSYRFGLPSHHAAIATYAFLIVGLIFIKVPFINYILVFILFIGWLFTLASRIMKNCENLIQIVVGIIIGLLYFLIFLKLIVYNFFQSSFGFDVPYFVTLPLAFSLLDIYPFSLLKNLQFVNQYNI